MQAAFVRLCPDMGLWLYRDWIILLPSWYGPVVCKQHFPLPKTGFDGSDVSKA